MKRLLLAAALLLLLSGCGPSQADYDELVGRVAELEQELDDCRNGPERRIGEVRAALEKKDYKEVVAVGGQLIERDPGTPEAKEAEVMMIAARVEIERQEEEERLAREREAEVARIVLIATFSAMKSTSFYFRQKLNIDIDTGKFSADNGEVRWVFNLGDMDFNRIVVERVVNGPHKRYATFRLWCKGGEGNCVSHATHVAGRSFRYSYPYYSFYVYTGTSPKPTWAMWTKTTRDLEAEQRISGAFKVLIRYRNSQAK